MDHPLPWLRYLDAGDCEDENIDFDGLNVESPTGERLGNIDGFIVDADSGRPYYVVVDAGGWFKSKYLLLPVGHTRFDREQGALITDLSRSRVDRFPGFDLGKFQTLTAEELTRLSD